MPLCFPEKILSQHLVVLGKTGAGKSSALRHIVEHLLDKGKRVCIVDPKGDWWGLKSSADGKDAGYPVIAFGSFKEERASDIPINDRAGKAIAELVATGNRPCILGFRGWMPGAMTRFWIDFASTIFNANAGELYLVIDEVHNFAAKGKIMDPESGKCLHWTNRLMSEGRGVGLVALIASQRPQKVHNDTLTCCETLVAMRVIHKADRQAVKDWIDGCGDGSSGNEVLSNIAQLDRGEAYLWSPAYGFGPKRLTFPMFETFDSFAPPQLQKKVGDQGWSKTDLEAVKTKLGAVIKEVEGNDPKRLHAEIAKLKMELSKKPPSIVPEQKPVEVPVLTQQQVQLIQSGIGTIGLLRSELQKLEDGVDEIRTNFSNLASVLAKSTRMVPVTVGGYSPHGATRPVRPPPPVSDQPNQSDNRVGKAERSFLGILVQRQDRPTRRSQLAVFTGYSSRSSHVDNTISKLRTMGLLSGRPDDLRITESGVAVIGQDYEVMPSGSALLEYWIRKVGKAPGQMLRVIAEASPNPLSRGNVAELTGYSPQSSHVDNSLSYLRTLELISGPRDSLRLNSDTFSL